MEAQDNNSVQDQSGNKSKPLLAVVFCAHFRATKMESDRIARFNDGKEPHSIFDWILEQRKLLEEKHGEPFVMTNNCGVIR